MQGIAYLKAWQWNFLLQGLPIIPLGIVTYFFLDSIPSAVQCKNKTESKALHFP
jgi:hypothetical protein